MSDDVTLLNSAAMGLGLRTVLTANRSLIVENDNGDSLAFARGVAPSTDQGISAVLEERDVVRSFLRSRGVVVPRTRVHRFGASEEELLRSMTEMGDRVAVRPAWQSRRLETAIDFGELLRVVESLQRVAGRNATRSGRPQSRFMIEEASEGVGTAVLIGYDEILWAPPGVDNGVVEAARRAVEVLPGIEVAAVRLARRYADGEILVTAISPIPRFHESGDHALGLAKRVMRGEAEQRGWHIGAERRDVSPMEVRMFGVPSSQEFETSFRNWLSAHASIEEASGAPDRVGIVESIRIDSHELAELGDRLMNGAVSGTYPLFVEVVPL